MRLQGRTRRTVIMTPVRGTTLKLNVHIVPHKLPGTLLSWHGEHRSLSCASYDDKMGSDPST